MHIFVDLNLTKWKSKQKKEYFQKQVQLPQWSCLSIFMMSKFELNFQMAQLSI